MVQLLHLKKIDLNQCTVNLSTQKISVTKLLNKHDVSSSPATMTTKKSEEFCKASTDN